MAAAAAAEAAKQNKETEKIEQNLNEWRNSILSELMYALPLIAHIVREKMIDWKE